MDTATGTVQPAQDAVGIAEPGMEVDLPAPYAPSAWLALVAERLPGPRGEYV
ncbi:hypothetical protein [Streptomyces sp. DSM 40907]|uniref:hypothetical protein n=1 Tax=Streptomyces kutzneri TaxID=3051179 RepID=UPI0028D56FA2|nr:hypothetical protein [Streptomyces sp. DSM 40907]